MQIAHFCHASCLLQYSLAVLSQIMFPPQKEISQKVDRCLTRGPQPADLQVSDRLAQAEAVPTMAACIDNTPALTRREPESWLNGHYTTPSVPFILFFPRQCANGLEQIKEIKCTTCNGL